MVRKQQNKFAVNNCTVKSFIAYPTLLVIWGQSLRTSQNSYRMGVCRNGQNYFKNIWDWSDSFGSVQDWSEFLKGHVGFLELFQEYAGFVRTLSGACGDWWIFHWEHAWLVRIPCVTYVVIIPFRSMWDKSEFLQKHAGLVRISFGSAQDWSDFLLLHVELS